MKNITKLIISLAFLGTPLIGELVDASEEFQSLEEIRKAATHFAAQNIRLGQNSTIEAGHLDPRLLLKKCDQSLTTAPLSPGRKTSNMTVIVKCNSVKPWTVYVPVKTKSYITVAIARRPLARGLPVGKADVLLEQRETYSLTAGYFENIEAILGRLPKRMLAKGSVISPRDLNIKKIISKGHKINILAEANGFTVKMPGLALTDAGKGDEIKVQNLSSKRTVTGTVIGPNTVKVAM